LSEKGAIISLQFAGIMQNIHERKQIEKFNLKTFAKTTLFINLL